MYTVADVQLPYTTLDLVIAKSETEVLDLRVGDMISDHALIRFTLRVKKPIAEAHWTTSRAWRRLSHDAFASDLSASRLCSDLVSLDNSASTDDLVKLYRDVMTNLLNKHCPMVKVRRTVKPMTPWFDADCRAARRCARSAERRFRRKRTTANKCNWAEKLKVMRALYEDKTTTTGARRSPPAKVTVSDCGEHSMAFLEKSRVTTQMH